MAARVKTDAHDTIKLAGLLASGLIPAVWVPPPEVRELRGLVAHRRRLINLCTQARNWLHAVLHRHNVTAPGSGLFATDQHAWWGTLSLPNVGKLRVRQDLTLLDHLESQLAEVEAELFRLSTIEPWVVQLHGIGMVTATVLLAAIGEIQRFPYAKQLVGYSSLGESIHASGQTHRTGGINKQGRRELRAVMVEAAWATAEHSAYWRQVFESNPMT